MIKNPALKYFLKNGLKEVKDLPAQTVGEMRLALALNFDNKKGFISAMSGAGIDKQRLELIFNNETHVSEQMGGLETATSANMATKTWDTKEGCCDECDAMNGETVPIDEPFSNGSMVAHGHPRCVCGTSYKKDEQSPPEGKVFTKSDLKSMSLSDYAASRDQIMEQVANGQIK